MGFNLIEIIIFLAVILIAIGEKIKKYIDKKIAKHEGKKKLSKLEKNLDEFDNLDEVLKQEKHEKEQMLYDMELLKQVSNQAYKELRDEIEEQEYLRKEGKISEYDKYSNIANAYKETTETIEKAERDIKNFRFLDSVEIEEDEIIEGPVITAIRKNEINFDIQLFKKWCKEIFKCIKSGTENEIKIVKYFISEEMYERLLHQIKQFEKDGIEFITEEVIIKECKLFDYAKWLEKEEIKVLIKADMKEYIIQKSTNEVLRGNNKKAYEKEIIMTFLKNNIKEKEGFITNCPNCGAETTNTTLGKCKYCDTLIFPIRYNWTLTKFETR